MANPNNGGVIMSSQSFVILMTAFFACLLATGFAFTSLY